MIRFKVAGLAAVLTGCLATDGAAAPVPVPYFAERVALGALPPVARRLPLEPRAIDLVTSGRQRGRYGGELRTLVSRAKDTRLMVVYGYARLVGYNRGLELEPDIARRVDVVEGRIFTLHLRRGHRWSDGQPFTSADFRYYWQRIANHPELSPFGLEPALLVDGEGPAFSTPDEWTVRYVWRRPNPHFLPALAGARPLYIYAPAHYLGRYHADRVGDAARLNEAAQSRGYRNWAALHNFLDSPYRNREAGVPSLQPWVLVTENVGQRIDFERNPYFHRVDGRGRQLPYLDRIRMLVTDSQLIPAKTGAGETDLQARGLGFSDYPYIKQSERHGKVEARLWRTTKGAHVALYPNLNARDEVWRRLLRDRRFRRALSLGIDRHEINQVIYYGLATEGNNTVHETSPLYRAGLRSRWATFEPAAANRLLDELGLERRGRGGVRRLPDGRAMEIVVETAGESSEQVDVLELIRDSWRKLGIKLFIKPLQREVLRNRIFSGRTLISVWGGWENGVALPSASPGELAPTSQQQLQWPMWGQYYQSGGKAGMPVDLPPAARLLDLYRAWNRTLDLSRKRDGWERMLSIHAEETYVIGIVASVPQPVAVAARLRNVPVEAVYNWDPGAHFGVYQPDTFWLDPPDGRH